MEGRALFFSTKEGFGRFWERVEGGCDRLTSRAPEVVFDGEIRGDWARYAHVWRVAFRPETRRFFEEGEQYFFW
jgi:hypothetical protein